MAWFKKKEKEMLPDLPNSGGLPQLPELSPDYMQNKPQGLPSVPDSTGNFNQQAIKNEIHGDNVKKGLQKSQFEPIHHEPIHHEPMVAEPMGLRKIEPAQPPRTKEITKDVRLKSHAKDVEPIYVRLDKFEAGLETFEEIKEKVNDVAELLDKIKEVRDKEEVELQEWEREIQLIKSRIEEIDNNIFSKLD
jgi:hypothetical protein